MIDLSKSKQLTMSSLLQKLLQKNRQNMVNRQCPEISFYKIN